MVVDTSAILAILGNEAESREFTRKIAVASAKRLSTGSYLECSIVVEAKHGAEGTRDLNLFINTAQIQLVPFDERQALVARQGYARFGKGRHPASLNFGDCFAYALSKTTSEPLLYKGNDFSETDITPA